MSAPPSPGSPSGGRGDAGLAVARRADILRAVNATGQARVAELARRLAVSEMTIRRDLDELEQRGLVHKVHGGAVPAGGSAEDPGFARKSQLEKAEKLAIAEAASYLVEAGMSLILSAGSTTWYLAGLLRDVPALTIVTNSPTVAMAIHEPATPGQQVVLTGGAYRTPSDALLGPLAESTLTSVHADLLFLGIHGFDLDRGLSAPTLAEASVDRVMIDQADRVVVLADHTKAGTAGFAAVAPLDEVDLLITGCALEAEWQRTLAEQVRALRLVDPADHDDTAASASDRP